MSVLFHDALLDHVLEIFSSEKCTVLLNCLFFCCKKRIEKYHMLALFDKTMELYDVGR